MIERSRDSLARLLAEDFEIVLAAVLVSVAGLNALASRIGVPYPIVLVLGGLALGLVPGMPDVELDPDLVLLVFLPPLLYFATFFSDQRVLRAYARVLALTPVGRSRRGRRVRRGRRLRSRQPDARMPTERRPSKR